MSKPQSTTFLPNSANDVAKFAARNVLPSPEVLDVNRMTWSCSFIRNRMFVRIERKISSI